MKPRSRERLPLWGYLLVGLVVLVWVVFKIDAFINIYHIDPDQPLQFVGIRRIFAKVHPICAFIPLTCITFPVVTAAYIVYVIVHLVRHRGSEADDPSSDADEDL